MKRSMAFATIGVLRKATIWVLAALLPLQITHMSPLLKMVVGDTGVEVVVGYGEAQASTNDSTPVSPEDIDIGAPYGTSVSKASHVMLPDEGSVYFYGAVDESPASSSGTFDEDSIGSDGALEIVYDPDVEEATSSEGPSGAAPDSDDESATAFGAASTETQDQDDQDTKAPAGLPGATSNPDALGEGDYEAKIGDTGYATFDEAWAELGGDASDLTILKDISTTGTFTTPAYPNAFQSTTLYLDNHMLRIGGSIQVPRGTSLRLGLHEENDVGTVATNIDNKGSFEIYSSDTSDVFTIDGNVYFTDNGDASNTMSLNAKTNIAGYYITDFHSLATLGSRFSTDQSLNAWISDNDELIEKLNSTEDIDDIPIFNGGSADVAEKITIGGYGLSPAEGASLKVIYNPDDNRIYLRKSFEAEFEAMIGDRRYLKLGDAIEAAKDAARAGNTAQTIKIVAPQAAVTCDYGYTTISGQGLTIDLNGHSITAARTDGHMLYLSSDSDLALVDSSDNPGGIVGHIQANNGCAVTADGISIDGNILGSAKDVALTDASVAGSVSAGADGTLSLKDTSVTGSVSAKTVEIENTGEEPLEIGGSVTATGGSFAYEGRVGIAGKLILSNASAELNGKTNNLMITTDHARDITLGEDFDAQSIEYTLTNSTDLARLNSSAETDDYVIFKGGNADIASLTQLAPGSFTNPLLAVAYDPQGGDGSGAIVIRKNRGIFLNGQKGNDSYAGTITRPVKTFEKAMELWRANPGAYDCIYISGTVEVSGEQTWDGEGVTIYRYPGKYDRIENGAAYPKEGFFYTSQAASSVPYLVYVTGANGSLTLRNVTIDGSANATAPEDSAPLVAVTKGATLKIEDGTILQNSDISGSGMTTVGGAVNANASTVKMSGGIVRGNTAKNGGGIAVYGGTFDMSGGVIQNNTANAFNSQQSQFGSGGGVDLQHGAVMNLSGGKISNNHAEGAGGGIAVGAINNANPPGSTLNMTDGEISGNTSRVVGGGIFVQCNSTANLTKGSVTENHTNGETRYGMYGGGGIYVNYDYGNAGWQPGLLKLSKVIITDNEAQANGGGLAGCPNSDVYLYLSDGGAIYANRARAAKDVFIDASPTSVYVETPQTDISPFMLGGGAYLWKDESGEFIDDSVLKGASHLTIHNDHVDGDDDVRKAYEANPQVFIMGNSSGTRGGGIGTNGTVVIGTPQEEPLSISAKKAWGEGTTPTRSVRLVLEQKLASGPDSTYRPVSYQVVDGTWSRWAYTFEELPALDPLTQERYAYRVVEDGSYVVDDVRIDEVYESEVTCDEGDGCWVITNTEKLSVDVTKVWNDSDDHDGIRPEAVTIRLLADGEDTGASLELTSANGWRGSFDGLAANGGGKPIAYTVSEDDVDGYEAIVEGSAQDGFVITNTHEVDSDSEDDPDPTPQPEPPDDSGDDPEQPEKKEPDVVPETPHQEEPNQSPIMSEVDRNAGRLPGMGELVMPLGIFAGFGGVSLGLGLIRRKRHGGS